MFRDGNLVAEQSVNQKPSWSSNTTYLGPYLARRAVEKVWNDQSGDPVTPQHQLIVPTISKLVLLQTRTKIYFIFK